jgi:hypothetical protein
MAKKTDITKIIVVINFIRCIPHHIRLPAFIRRPWMNQVFIDYNRVIGIL